MKYNLNKNIVNSKGFTIIEVLVAISVLMVSIAAALSIVPGGLTAARHAKNQVTASYLAQEAMELVRNNRDNGMIFESPGFPDPDVPATLTQWLSHVDDPGNGGVSIFSCLGQICGANAYLPTGHGVTLYLCSVNPVGCTPNNPLRYIDTPEGERLYGSGTPFDSAPQSIFTRTIEIVELPHAGPTGGSPMLGQSLLLEDNPDHSEIAVTVTVTWSDGGGTRKSVVLRENMFNWWH